MPAVRKYDLSVMRINGDRNVIDKNRAESCLCAADLDVSAIAGEYQSPQRQPSTAAIHRKKESVMSKQEEAGLILKLYELRREATMRRARDWYFLEFNPQSMADFTSAMFSDHSGHLRMVITYWDMAAGLVNNGAISPQLFNDTNGEHIGVFAKLEPLLGEIRSAYGPQFAVNFEKLIDATPDGRNRTTEARERIKAIRAQLSARQAA